MRAKHSSHPRAARKHGRKRAQISMLVGAPAALGQAARAVAAPGNTSSSTDFHSANLQNTAMLEHPSSANARLHALGNCTHRLVHPVLRQALYVGVLQSAEPTTTLAASADGIGAHTPVPDKVNPPDTRCGARRASSVGTLPLRPGLFASSLPSTVAHRTAQRRDTCSQ